eukprot:5437014-Pyramimonas_sp.AAC.1
MAGEPAAASGSSGSAAAAAPSPAGAAAAPVGAVAVAGSAIGSVAHNALHGHRDHISERFVEKGQNLFVVCERSYLQDANKVVRLWSPKGDTLLQRHPEVNNRVVGSAIKTYARSILEKGLMQSMRGNA